MYHTAICTIHKQVQYGDKGNMSKKLQPEIADIFDKVWDLLNRATDYTGEIKVDKECTAQDWFIAIVEEYDEKMAEKFSLINS